MVRSCGSRSEIDRHVRLVLGTISRKEHLVHNLEFHQPTLHQGRRGFVIRATDGYALGDFEAVHGEGGKRQCSNFYTQDGETYAATKTQEDGTCLFANGFLNNWVPYTTKNVWLPLEFISEHLTYRSDPELFGVGDVWQTSAQVYKRGFGDCEDHAVLLADWLSGMGHDARVVCGTVAWGSNGGGHCWVALFRDGKQYLLESTTKAPTRVLPLVALMTDYSADYMITKDSFWWRIDERGKRNYSEVHWRKTGAFEAYSDRCVQKKFRALAELALGKASEAYALVMSSSTEEDTGAPRAQTCSVPPLAAAMILREMNRLKEAHRYLQEVPQEQRTVTYDLEVAKTYEKQKNYHQALIWLRRAEARQPQLSDLIFMMAWVLDESGEYKGSERYYLRYIKQKPSSAAAYNNLAVIYERTGRLSRAHSYYKKAAALSPHNDLYDRNLARIAKMLKR